MFNIKNPLALFVFMWLFVLYIYSKQYSLILTTLNFQTITYIIVVCMTFFLSFYCIQIIFYEKKFVVRNTFTESGSILMKLKQFTILYLTFNSVIKSS